MNERILGGKTRGMVSSEEDWGLSEGYLDISNGVTGGYTGS